ncbi:uncharacterized protein LOC123528076 [Mercenaria mercenaria]|uniref:uncharacterized protein LOC123528076 n=1 Tax=Mercenaria mercenaria TaxID=6596 RepID=UPI001E1DCA41|nr:uncharacterized protein LOC123528076 [Mercenaria mercenaria]
MMLTFTVLVVLLMAGRATCSVLGHGCATDFDCPPIESSCTMAYPTTMVFEDRECEWCTVCIDESIPLDESGCPDRQVMCQGSRTPPENCKAQLVYSYNDKVCNYCDEDICINFSETQFVGSA